MMLGELRYLCFSSAVWNENVIPCRTIPLTQTRNPTIAHSIYTTSLSRFHPSLLIWLRSEFFGSPLLLLCQTFPGIYLRVFESMCSGVLVPNNLPLSVAYWCRVLSGRFMKKKLIPSCFCIYHSLTSLIHLTWVTNHFQELCGAVLHVLSYILLPRLWRRLAYGEVYRRGGTRTHGNNPIRMVGWVCCYLQILPACVSMIGVLNSGKDRDISNLSDCEFGAE